ncbi:Tat pathway signal sequence domain protein [Terricaulis silvestris]|uniref:Lipoprotein n=1 Tax=Terricaulis silvestris TaxID=2686094 RepID=A0A6I6MTQ5_9CAUL|nr:Tat pathway signal sequence domain protein [Terricaulis silvestris]QGZ94543.1 hypothetical protein DSM104635_01362 [Terricaulis silvestris]
MKLRAAIVLSLAVLALGACSSRSGRTVELPGGVTPEQERAATGANNVSLFDRLTGNDPRRNVGPCPLMGVLYDTSRMVDFAQPNNERYANIEFTGEVQGVRGLCRYVDADPIRMSIEVDMAFGRGPASTAERQTYRYWVAVARRGYAPIEKVYFDVEARWDRDEQVVRYTQEIEDIIIPRANAETSGENFEVLVGFDLTAEQLAFNRAGKRFRLDAVTGAPS